MTLKDEPLGDESQQTGDGHDAAGLHDCLQRRAVLRRRVFDRGGFIGLVGFSVCQLVGAGRRVEGAVVDVHRKTLWVTPFRVQ